MYRPIVKIKPSIGDKIVEILGLMIVVSMVWFSLTMYGRFSKIIPNDTNISMLIIVPIIGVILYIGLSVLQKFPHVLNYAVEVNDDNYIKLYSRAVKVIRYAKIVLVLTYAFIILRGTSTILNQNTLIV